MTISSENRKAGPYTGNGVTTEFAFTFRVFSVNDIQVVLTDEDGIESVLTLNSDYAVDLNEDQSVSAGGVIIYPHPTAIVPLPPNLPSTEKLTILGDIEFTQELDLVNGGAFNADNIEAALDKITMQIQQVKETADRSIKVGVSSTEDPNVLLDSVLTAQAATEAARDETIVLVDSFNDVYLGAKSSDPALDNDGNALQTGALYFNTSAAEMRIYTGSAWAAAYVTSGGFVAKSGDTMTGTLSLPNLTLTGTGARIRGDMSNGTVANRLMFQTSTTNSNSSVSVIPSGTATDSAFQAHNNSNPTDCAVAQVVATATEVSFRSAVNGTGTYLPFVFYNGGTERARIDVAGNFAFSKGIREAVYAVVDAAGVALTPNNGSIQTWTLGASRTPTSGTWNAGEAITLMINDGSAFTVTWTTLGVVWVGGSAPTLATTGFTVIELWKVGTTIYGALVGTVA